MEYKKILVKGVNWVGDAVFITPALSALRSGFPKAKISLLIPEKVAEIYQGNPDIDELVAYQRKEGLREKIELIRTLRKKKFDLGIIMQSTSYGPAVLFYLTRIPERVGYSHSLRNLLLTKVVKRSKGTQHEVDFFLGLVKSLGIKVEKKKVFMAEDGEAKEWAGNFLIENGYKENHPLVGIFPGAYFGPAKRWFTERYATLADRLIKNYRARVILFGEKNDFPLVQKFIDKMTVNLINAIGKTSLKQLRALIERCHLFITNDSGPLQIASTTKTPIIALFGSSDPKKTGPWRDEECTIIYKKVSCSPCFKRKCKKLTCFEEISVEDILQIAKTYLSREQ
ncbi:MAG TPA: lipopolysaccharide heptosyltransferase II [bacterium]|nr:lipopolysaccharide heptosyltransferase II [bacterium]